MLKAGDTVSRIQSTLENSGGTAVDIQGATVLFFMSPIGSSTLTVGGTATVDQVTDGSDGSKGKVHYAWNTADTATPGLYLAEWQARYATGGTQTFPNDDYIHVLITNDL